MRILVVVSGSQWLGGLTIQTALLCRELEQLGHQVAVVSIGADAVIDQFRHARTRWGASIADEFRDGRGKAQSDGEYVFRYEVVADAARYLPPGSLAVRSTLAPLARLGMALVSPPPGGPDPLVQARGAAARVMRAVTAALDAGLSGGAAEAPFLTRLLLNTDRQDLERLEEIRRWFQPDVEYACDLALVPILARLEDRGIPLVAAAQGFEVLQRRGVGLVDALRASRHRIDLVLSGSQANIEENVRHLASLAGIDAPARAIPYGVALDGGWELPRPEAIRRMHALEARLPPERRGGGLWGVAAGAWSGGPFIATCFSRIDVEKGADLVLHAVSILRRRGVPIRLWIAGNTMPASSYLDVLRSKIRLMDLSGCVSLIGTIRESADKIALLRASDAFVAGFIRSEPFGLVYTEAFASELAVVAPDTGAAPELMQAVGDTSTLYPANDTGALADRLYRLYAQPDARARIARAERQAFLERFNATEMAKAAAREFERAIACRAGRLHAA